MEKNASFPLILKVFLEKLFIWVRRAISLKEKILITNIAPHGEGDMNLLMLGAIALIKAMSVCVGVFKSHVPQVYFSNHRGSPCDSSVYEPR